MSLIQEACPNCGAPVQISVGTLRIKCPYCMMTLAVERQNGEVALEIADRITGSLERTSARTQATIQEGAYVTQAELRRLQIAQDLSVAQMRLSNVQGEIRSVERSPQTKVTHSQLRELRSQEVALRQQIAALHNVLYPTATSTAAGHAVTRSASTELIVPGIGLRRLLFSFEGRASRSAFWLGLLICLILASMIGATGSGADEPAGPGGLFALIATVLFCWIGLAVSVKRYHDRDKTGWWVLFFFVPIIGPLWTLFQLGFLPGTPGTNRYG